MMGAAKSVSDEQPWWNDLFKEYNEIYDSDENISYEEGDVCDLIDGTKFEAVFIPTLYSVVFVVGILGNGLLLGVLFQSRKRWSVIDTFILHLAVSDVLLLVTLPLWATQYASSRGWEFGTGLCKITGAIFTEGVGTHSHGNNIKTMSGTNFSGLPMMPQAV
ncbi:C-X-C chemokine receptor type 3-like [Girardinichthys multiradiatus]|uniref:C-X-C chemokine receptor type 3-like n=1 Tax=Girardinichthys multiradiatus TaxID=208333 RepID=UPI001FAD4DB0|nr:C-X-C chemokine receptor type 3-like [Girardinichthys multiradiatus]